MSNKLFIDKTFFIFNYSPFVIYMQYTACDIYYMRMIRSTEVQGIKKTTHLEMLRSLFQTVHPLKGKGNRSLSNRFKTHVNRNRLTTS